MPVRQQILVSLPSHLSKTYRKTLGHSLQKRSIFFLRFSCEWRLGARLCPVEKLIEKLHILQLLWPRIPDKLYRLRTRQRTQFSQPSSVQVTLQTLCFFQHTCHLMRAHVVSKCYFITLKKTPLASETLISFLVSTFFSSYWYNIGGNSISLRQMA